MCSEKMGNVIYFSVILLLQRLRWQASLNVLFFCLKLQAAAHSLAFCSFNLNSLFQGLLIVKPSQPQKSNPNPQNSNPHFISFSILFLPFHILSFSYYPSPLLFPPYFVTDDVNARIILNILLHSLPNKMKNMQEFDYDLSSEQRLQPFIGKYHQVLRKRKNQKAEGEEPTKKEYKRKKVLYKSLYNLYQQWKIEMPFSEKHVYNFHNILAINEDSMRNPESDESFLTTKFYMKKVKKVTIHHQFLLFSLEDINEECTPIPYICERLKSFGDSKCLEVAHTLEHLQETLSEIHKKLPREQEFDEAELQGFLVEMRSKLFFSQYSPNLLIISMGLLQLLGYNVQEFAIESIKYKSILYEFFSAEHYAGVIFKHLENINLLRDYLEGRMNLEQFCRKSLMVYNDFVYTRANKEIKCEFFAGTSKQLTPYIEIKQVKNDEQEVRNVMDQTVRKRKIEEFRNAHRKNQIELLRKIVNIPRQLDPSYSDKVCTYQLLESLIEDKSVTE